MINLFPKLPSSHSGLICLEHLEQTLTTAAWPLSWRQGDFLNKNLTLLNHAVEPPKEAPGLWAPGTQGSPSLCEPRALQLQLTAPPNSGLNQLRFPLPPSSENVTETAAWPAPPIFQTHGTFPCSDIKPRGTLGARTEGGGC